MTALREESTDYSVALLCGLFGKTREGYYALMRRKEHKFSEDELLRETLALRAQDPGLGCRKLHLMLRSAFGTRMIGYRSYSSFLSRHHLKLTQKIRCTTNSNHRYRKYSNLIKDMTIDRPNQVWVADITYITTQNGFCYLHLITDVFTHEVVGYVLSDRLFAEHTLQALKNAVAEYGRYGHEGLIHHSDRGIQYCCDAYTNYLTSLGCQISMTEDYNPTDNGVAERMNGILKQEWLYRLPVPESLEDARRIIDDAIAFYNGRRPHMSNGMLSPAQMRACYIRDSYDRQG